MKVSENRRDLRKKHTAEIFTPKELINEILEKLPLNSWEQGKSFCDPAAGNGNFLVEIYKWKVERYNHSPIKALSTLYAVELMADNVVEMKMRLYNMAKDYLGEEFDKKKEVIQKILQKNIVCHDALTYNFKFKDLNFIVRNKGKLTHLKNTNKWFTVEEVIERIKSGTAVRINGDVGVDIIKKDGKEYLRSKKNDTEDDNISSLPEEDLTLDTPKNMV